jgi:hypothetical protein
MALLDLNAQPTLDANGNPLPAQGTPPGAPPILQGTGGLADAVAAAYMKHLTVNQPPPVSVVVQKAKADAEAKQPVDTSRPPAPGSFGSKLASAAQGVMADLGDAAHATDVKGGGWLSGIASTLNARNERLAQNQRNEALLAKTQAETVALHRNIYQQDTLMRQAAYKGNQEFVDTYKVNHDIESGVNHNDLMKRAQTDKDFAKKYFVRATEDEPTLDANGEPKKDKDGNPVTSPLYTIITRATKDGSQDTKILSEAEATDMNKYLGSTMPKGTKLTSDQYAALNGQLNLTRNAVNIVNNTNEKELTPEQLKVLKPYLTDPTIQAAISHVPGSAYAGLLQYQKNADDHITQLQNQMEIARQKNDQQAFDTAKTQISDLTEERNKVSQFASQAISPKQIERYDKESEKAIGWVEKVLHDPSALAGDKASSVIPQLQEALKTETDPGRKAKLTSAISAATMARDNYFHDMDRKARADQVAKQGSPEAAGKALAAREVTLADLRTRSTNSDFILQSIEQAKKIDPNYNAADEVNFEHVAKSPQMAVFFGSARSLISKGGTLDQLMEWGKKIPDNSLPALNRLEDWQKLAAGKGPLAGYAALVLGVADDYGKVMGGGAASDSARDSALALFGAAQTHEQRLAAIQATLGGVGSQFDGRVGKNQFMEREYNDFTRSPLAPPRENSNNPPGQQKQQASQQAAQKAPQIHSMDVQRPKDLPSAVKTKDFKNNKTGQVQTYWTDISGKPLRPVASGELPQE